MRVLISGGGTGGHVYPALAIADALKALDSTIDIRFVGAKGKMEMKKVPERGYPIDGLWISGFDRRNMARNLALPFKLISSLWTAYRLIKRYRPEVDIGVGGYASGPVLEVAYRLDIPILIQEQNSFPGMTNRLLARKASLICVAFDRMDRYFPHDKIVQTGNPVRKDLLDVDRKKEEAQRFFGLGLNKKTMLVSGGSLGAKTLNDSVRNATELFRRHPAVNILWQVGTRYVPEYQNCETAALEQVRILPFIERMDLAYALADVVICRAGALTLSELCVVSRPAILVPSPNVAEDHQMKNARSLADRKAARIIRDEEAEKRLIPAAFELLEDEEEQLKMKEQLHALARPDADRRIAELVLDLAGSNSIHE